MTVNPYMNVYTKTRNHQKTLRKLESSNLLKTKRILKPGYKPSRGLGFTFSLLGGTVRTPAPFAAPLPHASLFWSAVWPCFLKITINFCAFGLHHGRRKDFFQGGGHQGIFTKFFQGGAKSGEICFYPIETKKPTIFCWNFQNPGDAWSPCPLVPPFQRPWPTCKFSWYLWFISMFQIISGLSMLSPKFYFLQDTIGLLTISDYNRSSATFGARLHSSTYKAPKSVDIRTSSNVQQLCDLIVDLSSG